ncbi:MAG TPA: transglycosylase SLT domain-containing protein [Pseudolabrys sp.]|nr:transglycosylase SLT domain-containing protein [Pseudolabrys sp.]
MAVEPTSASATPQVTGAIRQAANATGASFQYLLATAQIESRLDPGARAPTSTAQGLFQFIDQTWLQTLKEAGPSFGFTRYANAIAQTGAGRYEVADPSLRNAVMQLRNDPTANALMAGAYTRNNTMLLTAGLGRQPTEGELYIAHFMGADGAVRLIGAATAMPNANAASLFPGAAAANRSVFYDRAGRPRSVGDVYAVLTGRYVMARNTTNGVAAAPVAAVATLPSAPDTAGLTSAYANANPDSLPDNEPIFEALFRTRERRGPLAPVVSSLWNKPLADPNNAPNAAPANAAPASTASASNNQASQSGVQPLDLFRDAPVKMRGTLTGG